MRSGWRDKVAELAKCRILEAKRIIRLIFARYLPDTCPIPARYPPDSNRYRLCCPGRPMPPEAGRSPDPFADVGRSRQKPAERLNA
jgi:hypothetical protein